MFEFSEQKKIITIKRDISFLPQCIVVVAMVIFGVRLLLRFGLFTGNHTSSAVFPGLFLCGWIVFVLSIGVFAFINVIKQVTIDPDGISCNFIFGKRFIKWSEVKDWGISRFRPIRGKGNTYYLYFSVLECPVKNECKKELKGKMIKVLVSEREYSEIVDKIIPFCCEQVTVPPFVAK